MLQPVFAILTLAAFAGDAGAPQGTVPENVRHIERLLELQRRDWNRGDIDGFMEAYERSASLIFTSGGHVERGWSAALERYRRTYPDREAMGRLDFSGLEVTLLGPDSAVVLGRWALVRKSDGPHGVFTLVLRKGAAGWKIIHDHTSSAP